MGNYESAVGSEKHLVLFEGKACCIGCGAFVIRNFLREWAASVWMAYREQRALAHQWIRAAVVLNKV